MNLRSIARLLPEAVKVPLRTIVGGAKSENTIIFDRAMAEKTRRRDELPEYDALLSTYGRYFAQAASRRNVLDVGCGTGRYFRLFSDTDVIIGVDPFIPMLEQARNAVGVETLRNPPILIIGDTDNIPLLPGSFDLVFCIGVLGHLVPISKERVEYLRGFCRAGGLCVLSVLAKSTSQSHFCPATKPDIQAAISGIDAQVSQEEFIVPSIGITEQFFVITVGSITAP